MDACGYQYAHKDLSEDCVFEEHIEENNYNTYSRIRAGKKTYLALDNRGVARRTQIPVGRSLGNLSKLPARQPTSPPTRQPASSPARQLASPQAARPLAFACR
ncbi:fibroblast growth factor domain-containing protein [Phthorimaea operculella]|nr:fibroblast growth factor domain-containing protein [Phthorimaea operculella]